MRKISLVLLIGILLLTGCGKIAQSTGSDGGSSGGSNNPPAPPATTYTISATVSPNAAYGSIVKNPNQSSYSSDSQVQLSAVANSGYAFDYWEGDLTGTSGVQSVTMNANKNITAVFRTATATQYTLTVSTSGSGAVSKTPNSANYTDGTNVVLQATPDSGWQFDHWEGDISGTSNNVTININGNKSVTAVFVKEKRVVLIPKLLVVGGSENGFSAQGTASISPAPVAQREFKRSLTTSSGSVEFTFLEYTYDYNTTVVITATANASDKEFYGYKVTDSITLSDYSNDSLWAWTYTNPLSFDITKNIQIGDVATEYKAFTVPVIGAVTYDGLPTEWSGIEYARTSDGSDFDNTYAPTQSGTEINGIKLAQKDGELYILLDFDNGNPDVDFCNRTNFADVPTGDPTFLSYQFELSSEPDDGKCVNIWFEYTGLATGWRREFNNNITELDGSNQFTKAMINTPAQIVETSVPISDITNSLTAGSHGEYSLRVIVRRARSKTIPDFGDGLYIVDSISNFYIKF